MFRGIPYAKAPIGPLRFRAPEASESWSGTRPALKLRPSAPQNSPSTPMLGQLLGINALGQSEDCLVLNVWTPAADHKRRPVLVWIHGGAFVIGSGSTGLYAGGRMAKRGDVVVVTINYRLGALGFLNLHTIHDRHEANFGIRDQIAALEWVRDNIEQFGGDPENVTIFGESAGGMSVGTLLSTVAAGKLFHRAIAQSGAASNVSSADQAASVAELFLRELGEPRLDVEKLRHKPVGEILAAQLKSSARSGIELGILPFQPSLDGKLLAEPPLQRIAGGNAKSVTVMVGTNRDEWRLFMLGDAKGRRLDEDGLRRRIERALAKSEDPDALRVALAQYADPRRGGTPSDRWVEFQSDLIFHRPADALARAHTQSGGHTFSYLFTWSLPLVGRWMGAFHALEIPFVFGTARDGVFKRLFPFHTSIRTLSDAMQDAWVEFARHAAPHANDLPLWPAYDVDAPRGMVFDVECAVAALPISSPPIATADAA